MIEVIKKFRISDWLWVTSMILFIVGGFCFPGTYEYEWDLLKLSKDSYMIGFLLFSFFLVGMREFKWVLFTIMYCNLIFTWSVYSLGLNILTPAIIATIAMVILTTAFIVDKFGGAELAEGSGDDLFRMVADTDRYLNSPLYKEGLSGSNVREIIAYLHTHKIDLQKHEFKRCIEMLDGYLPRMSKRDMRIVFEIEDALEASFKKKHQ